MLGKVNTICTDLTCTLTHNKKAVSKIYIGKMIEENIYSLSDYLSDEVLQEVFIQNNLVNSQAIVSPKVPSS